MPAERSRPDDGMPTFTGDVPADATGTWRLFRLRFFTTLQRNRSARHGLSTGLAAVAFFASALVVYARPSWLIPVTGDAEVGAGLLALLSGGVSLVRRVPAVLRFFLGAVPGACGFVVGFDDGATGQGWWLLGGLVASVVYAVWCGMRMKLWAISRLARLEIGLNGADE